jgi:hypothetical protein
MVAVGRQIGKEETDTSFTGCPAPGPGGVKGTGTWRFQNLYQFLPRYKVEMRSNDTTHEPNLLHYRNPLR